MDYRPPPKFKVGDWVRLKPDEFNNDLRHYDGVYEIEHIRPVPLPFYKEEFEKTTYYYVDLIGAPTWWEDRMELVRSRGPIPLEDLI